MSTSRTRTAAAAPVAVTSVLVLALLSGCGSSGSTAGTSAAASSSAASVASSSPATRGSASTGGSGSATASSPTVSSPTAASPTAASSGAASAGATAEQEQYCRTSGGQVQTRAPYWNTNGSQNQWLALGGSATMCRFQADDEAKSRIYVDLTTLSSTEPTLAGLAYLSKVPMPASTGGGNPATGYCSKELNGSSTFGGGVSASGGGWVAQQDPDDVVVSLCVFPDGSFIDEWGLAYHSAGEVRGQDLTTVMRYQPSGSLPPVFPSGSAQPTS
ncbi:hypothetical protein Namu_4079 [Nakamurella multipartita DSM 44233]|uniref:DUF333 domain-containing protein n=2 Tax=Nakamurella TaxID=53460 RepID=C8XHR6_NAKMY|nr:hypothetical protein Namu_4079 [Nakamurella multipartita DSM 44233]